MDETPTPAKKPSLRRNFAWYMVGNIVYSGGQFALVFVLSHLASPAVVGIFGASRALTAPPLAFASLNLRKLLSATRNTEYKFDDYMGLRILALVVAMGFICVVGFTRYSLENALVILLVALTGVFDMLSDVIYGALQQAEQLNKISLSRSLQGVLQIVALTIGYWMTHSLLVAVSALFLMSAAVTFIYDVPNLVALKNQQHRDGMGDTSTEIVLRPRFDRARLQGLFVVALPLAISFTMMQLTVNIPRYFVEWRQGFAMVGFFTAMMGLMSASTMVQSAMGHSITPRMAKYYYYDKAKFQALSKKFLRISWLSFLLCVVIGALGFVLLRIFGKAYAQPEFRMPFFILMLGNAVHLVMAGWRDIVTAAQVLKPQPWIHMVGAGTIAGVCALLVGTDVPFFGGLAGASTGFLAGMIVMLICYVALGRKCLETAGMYAEGEHAVEIPS